jgi:purine-nucleoside phosphorylase
MVDIPGNKDFHVVYEKVKRCAEAVRKKTGFKPDIGLVLGSGLGNYADSMDIEEIIPYEEIDGFPVSTAPFHEGKIIMGTVGAVRVIAMKGRIHFYEGYHIQDVVLPIRMMCLLGAKAIMLTNAAGGIDTSFKAGDLMLIRDQISTFSPSPLIGPNIDEWGIRFPDMTYLYDRELIKLIKEAAEEEEIPLKEGVYLQTTGPQFETPAEIEMFRKIGASAVGMSTGVEAIAAHHMGARVCGISSISNMAAGMEGKKLSGDDVEDTASAGAETFARLVSRSLLKIGKSLK